MAWKSGFVKVANRLNSNRKYKGENDYVLIDDLAELVEKQQQHIKNIDRCWKRYQQKAINITDASKMFDESVIAFCGLENVNEVSETTSEGALVKSQQSIEEMLIKLDKFTNELKKAKKMRADYFTDKKLYEKATAKEDYKARLDSSEEKLLRRIEAIKASIPQELKKNESKMYEIAMQYCKVKQDKMTEIAKHTGNILELLRNGETSNQSVKPSEFSSPTINSTIDHGNHSADGYAMAREAPPNDSESAVTYLALSNTSSNAVNESDLATKPKPFDVVATFSYDAAECDELKFDAGDQITVREWPDPDDEIKSPEPGWLYGIHQKTGKKGLFPANHVKLL